VYGRWKWGHQGKNKNRKKEKEANDWHQGKLEKRIEDAGMAEV
jgi:hypothetical protein